MEKNNKVISLPKKKNQTKKKKEKKKVNVRGDGYVNNVDCGCLFTMYT